VAKWLRRFHLLMIFVWLGLSVPGLLLWRDAVWFVVIMSLYANLAAEFAAYQGARAEVKQDDNGAGEG
jgi:hypothetical protein